jgi:hypothetical protein
MTILITQRGNSAGRDVVGGDSYDQSTNITSTTINAPYSPLAVLYARLRTTDAADRNTARIADQLQHFCSTSTDGDVRGLEEKLTSAEREDMLQMATRLKQDATKIIMSLQTSPSAQAIITMILSKIYCDFTMHVRPLVEANCDRHIIDKMIGDKVINPVMSMLGDNDLMLNDADVLGFLFFLGGNCHIRWDKC